MRGKDFKIFYDCIGNALATNDDEWLHQIECGAYRFLQLTDRQVEKVFNLYKSFGCIGETVKMPNGKIYTQFGCEKQLLHLESEV